MSDYIASPRPIFRETDEKDTIGSLPKNHTRETAKRSNNTITIGGVTSGIVVKISKKGLEINGYYAGLTDRVKYANIRKFSLISWEDLDKMRTEVFERRKKKSTPKRRAVEPMIDKPDVGSLKKNHRAVSSKSLKEISQGEISPCETAAQFNSEEYLKKLPVVTLNGKGYYMDMERKERRPVDNPEKVYSFEGLATKKPV